LIAFPQFCTLPIMSVAPKDAPVPLAEISQGPNAFEAFLDRNQKGIVAFAILLSVGAAGLVVYRGIETSRQESAGAALNKAENADQLQAVITTHPSTLAAGSAMILLADQQWTDGKKDESVATLRSFLASFPEHPAVPTAKSSLGSKLMAQGKSGDAAAIFEDVASDPTARFIAPFALISLGDIAKAAGDLDKAETSYSKVRSDFADSSFADTASRRLAILKAQPPVEIAPPPAPPAPEAPAENAQAPISPPAESAPASEASDLPKAPNP
jgi:predicted negative regulator of RcsB-dependent stress response